MKKVKVDIIILTGFLGSGKSTLLKRYIEHMKKEQKRIGVLMNELGQISIDSALIPEDAPIKELLNGCICCSIQGELSTQLDTLLNNYDLDVIFIEATGAAHPLEVIDAVTHPFFASRVNINGVITVVNAHQWKEGKMSNKIRKLLKEQVRFSNTLILNKIDLLENVDSVITELIEINPHADLFKTSFSEFDISKISSDFQKREGHSSLHVKKDLQLKTITVELTGELDKDELIEWVRNFPISLYRAKGFVHIKGEKGLVLFNYAFGDPMFELYSGGQEYTPAIVLIGEELDRLIIEQQLHHLQSYEKKRLS